MRSKGPFFNTGNWLTAICSRQRFSLASKLLPVLCGRGINKLQNAKIYLICAIDPLLQPLPNKIRHIFVSIGFNYISCFYMFLSLIKKVTTTK